MKSVQFHGHECCQLTNGLLELMATRSIGPRILSLKLQGGVNLLAELPDLGADCPGTGIFHFYGGHRLWHAPEEPSRTYLFDDAPVDITPMEDGLLVTQDVEAKTGLQKSMEIRLSDGLPQAVITHRIANRGIWPIDCAVWAITQFRVGGLAMLPLTCEDTGVLPNRSLALWPYSHLRNPNLRWGSQYILLDAKMDAPFKIGFPNPRGWLAYWLDGTVFVKRAGYDAQATYCDFGSSSECYCCAEFIELETLAPITTIQPGGSASHVETWELHKDVEQPRNEKDIESIVKDLGLDS
ncbi:MAG: hypothetical protein FJZ87_17030 [Chloroflexi bacterium]|nr:hypothetical protein [Chloroflexota bacterium]